MAVGVSEGGTTNLILKIVSIVVFLGMAMAFGIMPYFITSCRTSSKFLGLANAFSGGLFLGIGLFHILPESAEKLEGLTKAPIAYFLAFASYAIILFVEKIAFDSHSLIHKHGHEQEHEHEQKHIQNSEEAHQQDLENVQSIEEENHKNEQVQSSEREHENANEPTIVNERNEKKSSGITPYILLFGLAFHGLFEGMALGIQSEIKGTVFLFLAIAAHKWAASLTLGISFVKVKLAKKQLIIMVMIFALIGPVGIALGLILSTTAGDNVEGILLAISTGTFIYIACSEVIIDEFENPNNKFIKFLMFMLGGIFTAGLSLMELLNHEDGEHSE